MSENTLVNNDFQKPSSKKNRKIYILGILLIWVASFFEASNMLGSIDKPDFSPSGFESKFFLMFLLTVPGLIFIAKGLGLWFTTQGKPEKIRILIACVLFAAIVSYFLIPIISFFFPITSIVFIIIIIKSRKWSK
jgi:drug/metabolite transporter (DMT)-like permease